MQSLYRVGVALETWTSKANELLSKIIGLECKGAIGQGLLSRLMIAFIMILEPAAPPPPISKLRKCMAVFDSGANRPPLAHFQNHENDASSIHFSADSRSSDSLALIRLSLKPFVFRTCVVQGVVQWVVRGLCGRFWLHGGFEWDFNQMGNEAEPLTYLAKTLI